MDGVMVSKNVERDEGEVEHDIRQQFRRPRTPEGFDSKADFIRYVMRLFQDDLDADRHNRRAAIEDAQFVAGDQWESWVQSVRERKKKPTLTVNRLPSFVAQVINNRRLNETEVKIIADDDAYRETAKVRESIIRAVQRNSSANRAYTKALENQVIGGLGNFGLELDFASDDVFDQDLRIYPINNPFAVVWDHGMADFTGADADHVFVVDSMDRKTFEARYPQAVAGSLSQDTDLLGLGVDAYAWDSGNEVLIAEFWKMKSRRRILGLLRDLDEPDDATQFEVVDVTDMDNDELLQRIVSRDDGTPILRDADVQYAEMYLVSSHDILEGPYELPIKRVPIFRAPGWELNVGDYKNRFGMVRFLKDPQRFLNYWRSAIAERLQQSPKGTWIASDAAVEGREKQWRESHLSDDPLLVWNSESGAPPTPVPPAQVETALITQAEIAERDLREVSNISEAALGRTSNEVSGRAIRARQEAAQLGSAVYQDNLTAAIEEAGKVMNDLIPFVYSTPRTVKVLGEDATELGTARINDETDDEAVDITAGKYQVTIKTGPSFETKRIESQENMLNMVNAMPQTMAVAADKIIEAQDWPGAGEIARRLRTQMPPGVIADADKMPGQVQREQQQAQMQQVQVEMQMAAQRADTQAKEAEARERLARALEAEADAAKTFSEVGVDMRRVLGDIEDARVSNMLRAFEVFNNANGGDQ